jgi:hypothetical protein
MQNEQKYCQRSVLRINIEVLWEAKLEFHSLGEGGWGNIVFGPLE